MLQDRLATPAFLSILVDTESSVLQKTHLNLVARPSRCESVSLLFAAHSAHCRILSSALAASRLSYVCPKYCELEDLLFSGAARCIPCLFGCVVVRKLVSKAKNENKERQDKSPNEAQQASCACSISVCGNGPCLGSSPPPGMRWRCSRCLRSAAIGLLHSSTPVIDCDPVQGQLVLIT